MARARNIKPGFFKNEQLAELPFEYRLLFIGLWTLADREGRLEDRPKRIRMEVFPGDDVDCEAGINALEACGLVVRYSVHGTPYVWIPTFAEHQKPHPREAPSSIPAYQGNAKAKSRRCLGDTKALASPSDVLNPDVLNPDSKPHHTVDSETAPGSTPCGAVPPDGGEATPTPPPDPAIYAAVDALRVSLAVGTAEHEAAGALWAVLSANSCTGTASHPAVVEMARSGVTAAQLRKAIAEARKTQDGPLNPAYLAAIVDRLKTAPPKANGKAAAWATDEKATEAKARELGLWPARGGESWDGLRNRIRAKLNTAAEESVR